MIDSQSAMYRRLCARKVNEDDAQYHEFEGQLIVVDLAEIDGKNESFEGAKWLETGPLQLVFTRFFDAFCRC